MQSYIGVITREKVKITYKSWKHVPRDVKDIIWDSVNFSFNVDQKWKSGCLSSANEKWRQYKTLLTNKYVLERINNPEQLNKPPSSNIDQSDWSTFVISRLSDDFKNLREKQQERRKCNIYPHQLSRKGYARHAEEISDQLCDDDDDVNRAILWISARLTKKGDHEGEQLKSTVAKIDDYIQQRKEGKFNVEGRKENILCKALQSEEHTGRVRGIGGHVTPSMFFHVPRGSTSTDKKLYIEQQKELLETRKKNSELDARVKRLEATIYKNADDFEIDEKGSCSVKYPPESPSHDEKKSPSHDGESDDDDDVEFLDKDDALQGKLVALTLESSTKIVAYGTVIKVDGANQILHGNHLPNNCLRVAIDEVEDEDALLPIPGECQSIGEAVGSHVAWPKHLIKLKDQKPRRKEGVNNATKPTLDSSSMPKTLYMLYCYVKLALAHKGNVILSLEENVFGHDRTLYVNMEDIIPFCQLRPISYTCICVYIWHLYKKMARENKLDKYRFVDPINIGKVPSTREDKKIIHKEMERRARALANRLKGTLTNQLVLAACNVGEHWILTVINPHKGDVYLLDPLYRDFHDQLWKQVVDLAIRMFNMEIQKNSRKQPTWEIIMQAPIQPDTFQCGYFVMRYMRHIVEDATANMASLRSIFMNAEYSKVHIDEVRSEWAECVQEHIHE